MKRPLFTRPFTQDEQIQLQLALKSDDAFRLRRAQYLLASQRGLKPREITQTYGDCQQNVRNVLRAFEVEGLDCPQSKSKRPKTVQVALGEEGLVRLHQLLSQSPQQFGKPDQHLDPAEAGRSRLRRGTIDPKVIV